MSADIWLEDQDGNQLVWDYPHAAVQNIANVNYGNNFNLTYNLTPMLMKAGMPHWSEMIGMGATLAGLKWCRVVLELHNNPDEYIAMNPANGWGSYDQAVAVLTALVDACIAHPEAKIGGWL